MCWAGDAGGLGWFQGINQAGRGWCAGHEPSAGLNPAYVGPSPGMNQLSLGPSLGRNQPSHGPPLGMNQLRHLSVLPPPPAGTGFMSRLSAHLRLLLEQKLACDPEWQHLAVSWEGVAPFLRWWTAAVGRSHAAAAVGLLFQAGQHACRHGAQPWLARSLPPAPPQPHNNRRSSSVTAASRGRGNTKSCVSSASSARR